MTGNAAISGPTSGGVGDIVEIVYTNTALQGSAPGTEHTLTVSDGGVQTDTLTVVMGEDGIFRGDFELPANWSIAQFNDTHENPKAPQFTVNIV